MASVYINQLKVVAFYFMCSECNLIVTVVIVRVGALM
jgi:hypothetical protein